MSDTYESNYERLPGRTRPLISVSDPERQKLWMGEDHLLVLGSRGYSERCRRFYFRDIQALTISRTARTPVLSIVLCASALLPGLVAFVMSFAELGPTAWIPFAGVGGALVATALVNLAFGPACVCTLSTAVQEVELTSLGRLRTAQRVVRRLADRIRAVQGTIPWPEQGEGNQGDSVLQAAGARLGPGGVRVNGAPSLPKRFESGTFHVILYALIALMGASWLADLTVESEVKNGIDTIYYALAVAVLVQALNRQRNSYIPLPLAIFTSAQVPVLVVAFLVSMVCRLTLSFDGGVANMVPRTHTDPLFQSFASWAGIALLAVGVVGLVMVLRFRANRAVAYRSETRLSDESRGDA